MKALIERYPALTLTILGVLAALAVKYVPGFAGVDVGEVTDYLALAISLATGIEIHRRVKVVDASERGF